MQMLILETNVSNNVIKQDQRLSVILQQKHVLINVPLIKDYLQIQLLNNVSITVLLGIMHMIIRLLMIIKLVYQFVQVPFLLIIRLNMDRVYKDVLKLLLYLEMW